MDAKLDIKTLHLQSKAIQFAFASLLAILIIVLGYFLFYSEQIDEYKAAQEKEVSLKEDFSNKSIRAANLPNLKEELQLIEASINDLLKQLPTDAQIPSLIQEMHQAAAKNGLTMNNVNPQPVVNDGQIQRLPFAISVTGSHDQIVNFTRDIGKMSRIVTLSDMDIKNADQKDTSGNKLIFAALANTYKALDASAPAASNTDAQNN